MVKNLYESILYTPNIITFDSLNCGCNFLSKTIEIKKLKKYFIYFYSFIKMSDKPNFYLCFINSKQNVCLQ